MNTILIAALSAYTTTANSLWGPGKAELSATPADPGSAVVCAATGPVFRAWGTTFNERDLDALRMVSDADREEILDRAFAPDGDLRFTKGRLTMNANDYSRAWYSCSEVDGDFENKFFNIEHDKTNSLVYVKWALKRNPQMTFFVSPWSPPAWMKLNKDYCVLSSRFNNQPKEKDALLYSGSSDAVDPNEMWLQGQRGRPFPHRLATQNYFIQEPAYLTCYAEQFVKFIDLYAAEGVKIDRVMYQNEAYSYTPYPGCPWTAEGTVRFNVEYLAPALRAAHPEVELWLGTFNTNRRSYMAQMIGAPGMKEAVKGLGFQWEGLDCAESLCAEFKLPFVCSEAECGNGRMDWAAGEHTFWLICKNLRYGAEEWYNWNYILEDSGRSAWGWHQNALVQVDSKTGKARYTHEYYAVKHYARYIRPGAVRVAKFLNIRATDGVVYRNPDGTHVLVAGNFGKHEQTISVKVGEKYVNLTMPGKSFNTVVF